MRRRNAVVLAAVLAATVNALPAGADQSEWAGFTCGFASVDGHNLLVRQRPEKLTGAVHGGPVIVADLLADDRSGLSAHPAAGAMHVRCTVQRNDPAHGGTAVATVSGSGTGVAYAFGTVEFYAATADDLYVCTYWQFVHDGTTYDYYYDGDEDPSNGRQCALAVSSGH